MLQLFYKTSSISAADWEVAYGRIESIACHFPLKLKRVESPDEYESKELRNEYYDLHENVGTDDESISFYGDWYSFSVGATIRFLKNWPKYVAEELRSDEEDPTKPITWYPHYPFRNDGSLPNANGKTTKHGYINTSGLPYECAVIAIGIMLENLLPQKVFLIAREVSFDKIKDVTAWLEAHFNEPFELPIYSDKVRLLNSFRQHYTDESHAVCRMEYLFKTQYKRNIAFALDNIGYKPTLDCYADILSSNGFGTFGFSDVLDPWIAATQDLERALEIIALSKQLLIKNGEEESAEEYDLNDILTDLLKSFILWTPLQREELSHFYTNQEALETGNESLWGSILRMTGNRVNICPMYADSKELFEAFMYHEPQKGKIFKQTIDEWIEKNTNSFESLKQKMSDLKIKNTELQDDDEDDDDEEDDEDIKLNQFLSQFKEHERPLLQLAAEANPVIIDEKTEIQNFLQRLQEIVDAEENSEHINQMLTSTVNILYIKTRLKELYLAVHPDFELWLTNEKKNRSVIVFLTVMMTLKLYETNHSYIRYRILWDKEIWRVWEGVSFKNKKIKNKK